jgi:hypothetical protein
MLRLLTEMMKLPVTLFVTGMEVFVQAMREYQRVAGQALDAAVEQAGADAQRPADPAAEAGNLPTDGTRCARQMQTTRPHDSQEKESSAMIDDRALGSEDLKTIRYRIIFTKRNHETTLKEDEATVNYVTDQGSLGGRYISDFWAAATLGGEHEARQRLIRAGYYDIRDAAAPAVPIPPDVLQRNPPPRWTIKDEDKKFITFKADLLDQLPRQKAEYDRERNEELRRIAAIPEEMRKLRDLLDDRLP